VLKFTHGYQKSKYLKLTEGSPSGCQRRFGLLSLVRARRIMYRGSSQLLCARRAMGFTAMTICFLTNAKDNISGMAFILFMFGVFGVLITAVNKIRR
jgi:hypothetical protein